MKVFKKILLYFCVLLFATAAAGAGFYYFCTSDYDFNAEKLLKSGVSVTFFDNSGKEISADLLSSDNASTTASDRGEEINICEKTGKNSEETFDEVKTANAKFESIDELPDFLPGAFIAVEDKRFYKHGGIDFRALIRAAKNNVLSGNFKEGGSTITQQLIKNTHLSGEKTFKRKLRELKLTLQAEKQLTKKQILYYYLTTIYFGENCYGIESAAQNYFGKHAKNLDLNECASLAATVKSPAYYNPKKRANAKRKDLVLTLMHNQKLISSEQFSAFYGKNVEITEKSNAKCEYFSGALEEIYAKFDLSPYEQSNLKIYTYFDKETYKKLEEVLSDYPENASASVITQNGEIIAEIGRAGEKRSPASTIKPLLVYAPAIETKTVCLATKINDERTDFSGYSPKNYGDVYLGEVNVKDALKKSLNVPAVKILNATGLKKSAGYAQKAGVEITDLSLASALGAIGEGINLTKLCGAYTVFASGGEYFCPSYVKKAISGGKVIFSGEKSFKNSAANSGNERGKDAKNKNACGGTSACGVKVFSCGTAALINECLAECAQSGTARALNDKPYTVCAKTGTDGDKSGNNDAYTVAYTASHVIGIRFSGKNGEKLPDFITGGYVAEYTSRFLNEFYKNAPPADFKQTDEIISADICRVGYDDGKIILADPNAPEKYVLRFDFLKDGLPTETSTEFSRPRVLNGEIKVKNGAVEISLERKNFVCAEIIRSDQSGSKKIADLVSDGGFTDGKLNNGTYSYSVIPYVLAKNGEKIYGDEKFLGTIIIYDKITDNDWWND